MILGYYARVSMCVNECLAVWSQIMGSCGSDMGHEFDLKCRSQLKMVISLCLDHSANTAPWSSHLWPLSSRGHNFSISLFFQRPVLHHCQVRRQNSCFTQMASWCGGMQTWNMLQLSLLVSNYFFFPLPKTLNMTNPVWEKWLLTRETDFYVIQLFFEYE